MRNASSETAELLGIKEGSAVLEIERIAFDSMGTPREHLVAEYRPDAYYLEMELEN